MSRGPTRLEDIAALAGVSIATASRALNDNPAVNARTKQLIWKLAREHDYPFRRSMPAGPIGATGTIALAIPEPQGRGGQMADPFVLDLIAGIGDAVTLAAGSAAAGDDACANAGAAASDSMSAASALRRSLRGTGSR